jgi:hypothetical protein
MTITFQDYNTTLAADKMIELIKTMRTYLVSVVRSKGKWKTIAKQNVMCVKGHCNLNIRYYTPFQKRRSPASAGKQLGYQLEVRHCTDLLLCIMWNESGPIYVHTYHSGPWDTHLVPPVSGKKAASGSKRIALAS